MSKLFYENTHRGPRLMMGRVWIVVVAVVLRLNWILLPFSPPGGHQLMIASIIVSDLWTTGVLGCVWQRMNWARYAFVIVLAASLGAHGFVIASIVGEQRFSLGHLLPIALLILPYSFCGYAVFQFDSIRKLTRARRNRR